MSFAEIIPAGRLRPASRFRPAPNFAHHFASAVALCCAAISAALPVLAFYPALMNADSLALYAGAVLPAPVMDWHSPFLTWLLRLSIAAGGGVAAFIAMQSAIYVLAFYGVLAAARIGLGTRLAVLLLVLIVPPALPWLATVEKTSFMAAVLAACFLCSLRLEFARAPGRLLLAMLALAAIGTWCRPNGIIMFLPLAVYSAAQASRHGLRKIPACAYVAVFLLLGLGAPALAVQLGAVVPTYPQQATMDLDLLNLSARTGQDLLPPDVLFVPSAKAPLAKVWEMMAPDPFLLAPVNTSLRRITDRAGMHELQSAWLGAIRAHPRTYLHYRLDLYRTYLCFDLSVVCPDSWHWYTGGIDANPFGLASRNYPPAFAFYKALAGSVFFHPFFGLASVFLVLLGAVALRHGPVSVYAAVLLLYDLSNALLIPGISARMAIPLGLMLPVLIAGLYAPGARPRWGNVTRATVR